MILLRYYKTRNKERKVMGYMKTLVTHIHCVCFLVGVFDVLPNFPFIASEKMCDFYL